MPRLAGDLRSLLKDSANVCEVPGSTVQYAEYICVTMINPNPFFAVPVVSNPR